MKIANRIPAGFLYILFFLSGGFIAIGDKVVQKTSWSELATPWYFCVFFSGAFYGLIAFLAKHETQAEANDAATNVANTVLQKTDSGVKIVKNEGTNMDQSH